MKLLQTLLAAAVLALPLPTPVLAQNDVCYRAGGTVGNQRTRVIDENATATWQQMLARQDAQVIQAMVGVWYGEIAAPQLNMTSYQYRQYEANGLFQYQDKTCTNGSSYCSQNQGHGFFTATTANDGSILTFLIVSDLNRENECAGGYARFIDANTMQEGSGTVWRRVQ